MSVQQAMTARDATLALAQNGVWQNGMGPNAAAPWALAPRPRRATPAPIPLSGPISGPMSGPGPVPAATAAHGAMRAAAPSPDSLQALPGRAWPGARAMAQAGFAAWGALAPSAATTTAPVTVTPAAADGGWAGAATGLAVAASLPGGAGAGVTGADRPAPPFAAPGIGLVGGDGMGGDWAGALAPPASALADRAPAGGAVLLDGVAMGRWMADTLSRAASRPQTGATGFDPLLSPRFAGSLGG